MADAAARHPSPECSYNSRFLLILAVSVLLHGAFLFFISRVDYSPAARPEAPQAVELRLEAAPSTQVGDSTAEQQPAAQAAEPQAQVGDSTAEQQSAAQVAEPQAQVSDSTAEQQPAASQAAKPQTESAPADPAAQAADPQTESAPADPAAQAASQAAGPQPQTESEPAASPAASQTGSQPAAETRPQAGSTSPRPSEPVTFADRSEGAVLPRPEYPAVARRFGQEGTVLLELVIAADGSVRRAVVEQSSGYPVLDQSAVDAAENRWSFPSYSEEVRVKKRVEFVLD